MFIFQKADGQAVASCREYDIASATVIRQGQVVKLADGLVVAALAGETGAILGIAAEGHSGVDDAINPRSNGVKIAVYDDPMMIMQCAAPKVTAGGGSATSVILSSMAAFAANDLKGGYVKLVSKAEGSTNTDVIGQVRRISASAAADSGNVTVTVEQGGAAASGDVYAVFPPLGFKKGNLGGNDGLVLSASANLPLKVVGHDRDLGTVKLMAHLHALGVEE